jgi:hypothetical protein
LRFPPETKVFDAGDHKYYRAALSTCILFSYPMDW